MIQFILAYLQRINVKGDMVLVYSTRKSTTSTGFMPGCSITTYHPERSASSSATLWVDESIHKEATLKANSPTIYIEVDTSNPKDWVETGATQSVAQYNASIATPTATPDAPVAEPVPVQAPV